ncbi:hypothetical protein PALB_37680 [Pseudoalteromonas luteoviolacea B = ATCC 29581]|nr:hypothetical protein PALB_37680 [Pseudoalteromonas luteoviolacea B = ATCC 29581]
MYLLTLRDGRIRGHFYTNRLNEEFYLEASKACRLHSENFAI